MKFVITKFAFLILMFQAFFAMGCAKGEADSTDAVEVEQNINFEDCGYGVGDNPCNFSLTDQNNKKFNLWDHYGSAMVLDFSSMWCGYCRIAASTIQETQDRYAAQGFYYVTILVEDYDGSTVEQDDLQSWATAAGITTAPVLAADMSMMDPTGESGWPVTGWPTFVVIDKEMTIYYGQRGWNEAAIEAAIQGALAE